MWNKRAVQDVVAVTGVGMAMAIAAPAGAQVQVDSSGTALDANIQVGSGGVNQADGRVDFSNQNAVITGNVAGGRAFRDEVGYTAPGEFRGAVPSDSLFGFRRDSLGSSPAVLNAPGLGGVGGPNPSVLRSFGSVRSEPLTGVAIDLPSGPAGGGNQIGDRFDFGHDVSTNPFNRQTILTDRGVTLGTFATEGGGELEVTASPLFGQRALEQRERQTRELLSAADRAAAQYRELTGDEGFAVDDEFTPEDYSIQDQRVEPTQFGEPPYGAPLLPGTDPDELPLLEGEELDERERAVLDQAVTLMPTRMLGWQLRTQLDPRDQAGGVNPLAEDRVRRLERALFERRQAATEPGESAYGDLMRQILEGGEREDEREEGPDLDEPSREAIERAELTRLNALRRAYGLPAIERPEFDSREGEAPAVGEGERGRLPVTDTEEEVEGALAELLQKLNYELPRLTTLAGRNESTLNERMRAAEAELASGNFFAAEGKFREVLLYASEEPLARVGLIHAQLGAGMMRSAATNLRILFEKHPELIAVRYDERLLPNESRLKWIQGELDRIVGSGDPSPDAGMLMAYLGHQAGSRQLVRYGLAIAEARSPRDPLLAVMRHIWLEAPTQDRGEGPDPDGAATGDGSRDAPAIGK